MVMSKKVLNSIVIVLTLVIIVIATAVLLEPLETTGKLDFILPFASMKDFEIYDTKKVDYTEDEAKLKGFITEFLTFLTEEYKYSKDPNAPLNIKYNSYFTQKAPNAIDNYEYKSDYKKDNDAVFYRAIYVDTVSIRGMKLEGEGELKVISKNNDKLKFVGEEGSRYYVLYSNNISRNKKVQENGIYMNYGGERYSTKEYIEFEIYEYCGELKVHGITRRSSEDEIEVFKKYFTDNQSELYSYEEILARINYSKDGVAVKKYIYQDSNSTNTKLVSEFDDKDIERVVRTNMDEVVIIYNLAANGRVNSIGSGFFIKPGIILTNWHVIDGADQLKIIMNNGRECELDGIVSANDNIDLAIVKLKHELGKGVTFANLQALDNSSPVVAIGHPLGNLYTVTVGSYDKNIVNQEVNFMQSQLPLLPGNSGGPLLDKNGDVIGINTAITAGNTTLSLPYKYIDNILQSLKKYNFNEIEVYKK